VENLRTALRLCSMTMVLIGFISCASDPVAFDQARSVESGKRLQGFAQYGTPTDGACRVTVIRDSCFFGAAANVLLSIDGNPVAKIGDSESLELSVQPGEYIFSVAFSPRIGTMLVEKSVEVKPGKQRAIRIAVDPEGSLSLHDTTPPK
jgi:hypothetical protein